ncbi:MAG: FMN-binding protein [Oscillospiraceae bacterium]
MKGNVKQDFVAPIAVLTVICLVVSMLLGATNAVTKPIIAEAERAAAEAARVEVLPGADSFTPLTDLEGLPDGVREVYQADNGAGIVVIAAGTGYGGEMKIIVGIDKDGKITGTKTLAHVETQGLGAKTAAPKFQGQFVGKDAALEGVSTIGGATISSKAFISLVEQAFTTYTIASGGAYENPVGLDDVKLQRYYPEVKEFKSVTAADGTKGILCDETKGYVVFATAEGYHGPITVAVLFGPEDDTMLGVVVDSHTETQGLGSRVAEEPFTSQFIGKNTTGSVDSIAGSTVSSDAFIKAVNEAIAKLPAVKEAK